LTSQWFRPIRGAGPRRSYCCEHQADEQHIAENRDEQQRGDRFLDKLLAAPHSQQRTPLAANDVRPKGGSNSGGGLKGDGLKITLDRPAGFAAGDDVVIYDVSAGDGLRVQTVSELPPATAKTP
jgi:hypothetical protein